MVIVRLIGGLGNQLFQYAAARSLAEYHNTDLKLDISPFETYKLHKFALTNFNIKGTLATRVEVEKLTRVSILEKILNRLPSPLRSRLFERRSVFREYVLGPFNPSIFSTSKDVYLEGYWQSEKYFLKVQDIIRKEVTLNTEISFQSQEIADQIANSQAVSIHIRRGDYVLNPETNRIHGTCDLQYYYECIEEIRKKIASLQFFIFSDDPNWVVENLKIDHPVTFVSHNDAARNYEDLYLMSLCQHNIIANSSFSWWGAWLNNNPEKIVYAPGRWFSDQSIDTRDVIPSSWIKME